MSVESDQANDHFSKAKEKTDLPLIGKLGNIAEKLM